MDLSIELGVPIIVVAQSNRSVENKEEGPDVDNIRDSDGIAYNASIVISGVQKGPGIEINPKKNRNGKNNEKLLYAWDIDIGEFNFVPNSENTTQADTEGVERARAEYKTGSEVF
jgi:replicative DNA helicase